MPRKRREEEELLEEDEITEEDEEVRPSGRLDQFDENGELIEEGEPFYIEDETEEED
jgi:hypothetical protein